MTASIARKHFPSIRLLCTFVLTLSHLLLIEDTQVERNMFLLFEIANAFMLVSESCVSVTDAPVESIFVEYDYKCSE